MIAGSLLTSFFMALTLTPYTLASQQQTTPTTFSCFFRLPQDIQYHILSYVPLKQYYFFIYLKQFKLSDYLARKILTIQSDYVIHHLENSFILHEQLQETLKLGYRTPKSDAYIKFITHSFDIKPFMNTKKTVCERLSTFYQDISPENKKTLLNNARTSIKQISSRIPHYIALSTNQLPPQHINKIDIAKNHSSFTPNDVYSPETATAGLLHIILLKDLLALSDAKKTTKRILHLSDGNLGILLFTQDDAQMLQLTHNKTLR